MKLPQLPPGRDLAAGHLDLLALVAALGVVLAADDLAAVLEVVLVLDLPLVALVVHVADVEEARTGRSGYSAMPNIVLGVSPWSSHWKRPPMAIARTGWVWSSSSAQRAMSSWWVPWLFRSPLPVFQNQCQL